MFGLYFENIDYFYYFYCFYCFIFKVLRISLGWFYRKFIVFANILR